MHISSTLVAPGTGPTGRVSPRLCSRAQIRPGRLIATLRRTSGQLTLALDGPVTPLMLLDAAETVRALVTPTRL